MVIVGGHLGVRTKDNTSRKRKNRHFHLIISRLRVPSYTHDRVRSQQSKTSINTKNVLKFAFEVIEVYIEMRAGPRLREPGEREIEHERL